jgi:Metal-dependent hydrolases of the beta-lactamase superfamily III
MNRLTVLGSGFAVANRHQENSYLMVQTTNHTVLIDCGNNPVGKLQQVGESITEISELVLTHAHADHMGALPLLMMDMWLRKRQAPLPIYGLDYTLTKARALLDLYDWSKWAGMFPVEFHMIPESGVSELFADSEITFSAGPVKHLIPTAGVRIHFKQTGKTFVYTCDTEPDASVDRLAAGADLLIHEAAGPGKGHSSPEECGADASRAGAAQLVLIHYDAARAESELIEKAAQTFSGQVVVAKDLMVFE